MENKNNSKLFRWFYMKYFRKQKISLMLIIVLIIIGVTVSNIGPLLYGRMIDLITASNLIELKNYILIYFISIITSIALSIAETYVGQFLTFKVTHSVKSHLVNSIIKMRFNNLDKYAVGELISRLESDAGTVVEYYINFATSIVLIVFNLIISLYFLITISTKLSMFSIIYIPISLAITMIFRTKYRTLSIKQKEYSDKYFSFINESFSNIKGIRSFQLENNTLKRFKMFIGENFLLMKNSMHVNNLMGTIDQIVSLCFTLALIYLSAVLIMSGKLTIGSMVAFNTYNDKLLNAISKLMGLNLSAQNVLVCLDRIKKLDDEPCEHESSKSIKHLSINEISISHVFFNYSADVPVLRDFSLTLKKPGLYCIVGKNGCGKSTIAKLLLSFYDCDDGLIRYNGIDIQKLSMSEVRRNFTYISKDPFILKDTLINNILLANPESTEEEARCACKTAGLTELIDSLPEGYNTILSEGGESLSSGQKQKINAARMLIRKTPIYFLDEVTSDLDGMAEKQIMNIIRELAKTSIVIFISHKVSTLTCCDRIYVMSQGHIVTEGTHQELLTKSHIYKNLFGTVESERYNESKTY